MKINHSPGDRSGLPGTLRHSIVGLAIEESDTSQLRRIIWELLPDILERFAQKNAQYGENTFALGARGQFPEIWRKVGVLKRRIWDEAAKPSDNIDTTEEVIDDLIGHLLMLRDCLKLSRGVKATSARENAPQPLGGAEAYREAADTSGKTWTMPGADARGRVRHPGVRDLIGAAGHVLRVARPDEERCGWKRGDPAHVSEDQRCLGIEGHSPDTQATDRGTYYPETHHINAQLEAWPV